LRVCGIDEAGRGAVVGPMVVAGVLVDLEGIEELVRIGVRDSKKLSPRARMGLSKLIRDVADRIEVIVLDAGTVNGSTRRRGSGGLNKLEARVFAEIIDRLKPDAAYIDLPSTNYDEFRGLLEGLTLHKCPLILEHKADEKYPVVSAASIIAKCERDRLIEELKAKMGDFGSGYPSDPKTRSFLMEAMRSGLMAGEYVRSSWRTLSRIAQRRLDEFSRE